MLTRLITFILFTCNAAIGGIIPPLSPDKHHPFINQFSSNPAALAFIDLKSAGLAYTGKYLLPELGQKCAVITLPLTNGALSCYMERTGGGYFRNDFLKLSYGMSLDKSLNAGVSLGYRHFSAGGEQPTHRIVPGIGVTAVNKNVIMAIWMKDLPGENSAIEGSVRFEQNEKAAVTAGFQYLTKTVPALLGALSYYPSHRLGVHAAFMHKTQSFSFGTTLQARKLLISCETEIHPVLGVSPSISITIAPGS